MNLKLNKDEGPHVTKVEENEKSNHNNSCAITILFYILCIIIILHNMLYIVYIYACIIYICVCVCSICALIYCGHFTYISLILIYLNS